MIGSVEFIKCAGCLATSEHPVVITDADMDEYVVKTYTNVQFVEDMVQAMVLPSFDGWSDCNMVRLTQTNQDEGATPWMGYYWITDANRSSDVVGATVFNLEFNAITTLLKLGSKVNGIWNRSPTNFTPWLQQNTASGTMGLVSRVPLMPMMPSAPFETPKKTLWVSLTASKTPANVEGSYEIYGFPIYANTLKELYDDQDLVSIPYSYSSTDHEHTTRLYFPKLSELFHGELLEKIGIAPASIIDISITPYMPFECEFPDSSEPSYFKLTGLTPVHITYNDGEKDTQSVRVMYNITSHTDDINLVAEVTDTMLHPMYAISGQLSVMKGDGSLLSSIPSNWASGPDGAGYYHLKMKGEVICDYAQIVYRISVLKASKEFESETDEWGSFVVPGTHIPYMGTVWDDYRAYSMSFEREAQEFAMSQAWNAAIFNTVAAVANIFTFGAVGQVNYENEVQHAKYPDEYTQAWKGQQIQAGVSTGTGIGGSLLSAFQQQHAMEFNRELTKRQTQAQPGNPYNASDGLFNLYMEMAYPTCLAIFIPSNLTFDTFTKFIKDFGYANEGEKELTITYGFYQGTVISTPDMTGPRFVELIKDFMTGVRMVKPNGDTPFVIPAYDKPPSAEGIIVIVK